MRKKIGSPSKHISYFAVRDACQTPECPVCWLVNKYIENYFDTLLYENDSGFRSRFRADYGFCNYHTYIFAGYNDGLAIALTHRDLLSAALDGLRSRSQRYLEQPDPTGCLVCELAVIDIVIRNIILKRADRQRSAGQP